VQKSAGWGTSITNLNSTVDKLKASNDKLEKELAKERDDRKAERDRLEERLAVRSSGGRDDRNAERDSGVG
jgi:septal ring factor EnvC (AmiA/AmiB activator)